jgi:hypothetical protein
MLIYFEINHKHNNNFRINVSFRDSGKNTRQRSVISGFRRDVDKKCPLLGCYAASGCNPLPTFRDNVSVPPSKVKKSSEAGSLDFLTLENETDTLYWNVCKRLPLDAA